MKGHPIIIKVILIASLITIFIIVQAININVALDTINHISTDPIIMNHKMESLVKKNHLMDTPTRIITNSMKE